MSKHKRHTSDTVYDQSLMMLELVSHDRWSLLKALLSVCQSVCLSHSWTILYKSTIFIHSFHLFCTRQHHP